MSLSETLDAPADEIAPAASKPLLSVNQLTRVYGSRIGCADVSFDLWPGEVLAIVGESGSGKTTLLNCISSRMTPTCGTVHYRMRDGVSADIYKMAEAERRLMAVGNRHYGNIRNTAIEWLSRVEIGEDRVDDQPRTFSGGMRQRLQIARNLVTEPRLVFMDEPTGGLDVSVQARLLDLLRGLVSDLGLAVVVVTHDLAVARLLSDRMIVMKEGRVIEAGLTDRVLDDPRAPYTQLLVSSILQV